MMAHFDVIFGSFEAPKSCDYPNIWKTRYRLSKLANIVTHNCCYFIFTNINEVNTQTPVVNNSRNVEKHTYHKKEYRKISKFLSKANLLSV